MAKAFINDENLTDIADAIRATLDESRQYLPSEMAAAIDSIPIMAQLNRKKYFQSVPAGAASGYATIERIEGNTVAWNQLVDTGIYANVLPYSSAVTEVSVNSDNEIEVKTIATAGASYNRGFKTSPFSSLSNIVGHKYLLLCESKSSAQYSYSSDSALMGVTSPFTILDYTANQWCTTGTIITAVNTNNSFILRVSEQPAVGSYYYFRNFQLIDLTRIFGSGNEPTTVEDYEVWREQNGLPAYADYNAGELLSVKMSGVKSIGFNWFDTNTLEVGKYRDINNTESVNAGRMRSDVYFEVQPNQHYYAYNNEVSSAYGVVICWYDSNKVFLSGVAAGTRIVTSPNDACYMRVSSAANVGDICINLSDPVKNGTYEPYQSASADIDVTTITGINSSTDVREVMFADGMNSTIDGDVDVIDLMNDTAERATFVLPDTYQELEYIESSGTQYIDTNIVPNLDYEFEIKAKKQSGFSLIGSGSSDYTLTGSSTQNYLLLGNARTYVTTTIDPNAVHIWKVKDGYLYCDEEAASLNSSAVTPTNSFALFARKVNSTTYNDAGSHVVYYVKIYDDNGELVFWGIPVRRISDSVLGMYDVVTDTLFTNAGTGSFIAGANVYKAHALDTSIVYTDLQDANGNPLNPRYKVEQGGTEQVLPGNTSTPTTVAPTLSTIYKKNI